MNGNVAETGGNYKGVHYSSLYFWVYFTFPNKTFNLKNKLRVLFFFGFNPITSIDMKRHEGSVLYHTASKNYDENVFVHMTFTRQTST